MQRLTRPHATVFDLSSAHDPVLFVQQGELFVVETEDASSGILTSGDVLPTESSLPYTAYTPSKANPCNGPIYIDSISPRSRMRIDIVDIDLATTGVYYNRPPLSSLGNLRHWPEAGEAWIAQISHHAGEAVISDRLRWPVRPMIGTLACAPEWETRSTATGQGPWGGNLDVTEFTPGATVYLTAYHDGGLLYVGAVHGCQGSGEYLGVADESRADVVLRVSSAEGRPLLFPRIETDTSITALGIDKPLERATAHAIEHLMEWLIEDYSYTSREAYLTIGLNPDFRITVHQMTAIRDLQFVVGASLPKVYLNGT
jgi:amidase